MIKSTVPALFSDFWMLSVVLAELFTVVLCDESTSNRCPESSSHNFLESSIEYVGIADTQDMKGVHVYKWYLRSKRNIQGRISLMINLTTSDDEWFVFFKSPHALRLYADREEYVNMYSEANAYVKLILTCANGEEYTTGVFKKVDNDFQMVDWEEEKAKIFGMSKAALVSIIVGLAIALVIIVLVLINVAK